MSKLGTAEFTSGGVILDYDPSATDIIHKQFPFLFLFCPLQLSSMASTLTFSHEYSFLIKKFKKKIDFAICKGCEILLLTTFILPYNILRQFGTAILS